MIKVLEYAKGTLRSLAQKARNTSDGMSLIEVLVALMIFSLIVISFTAYFVSTFKIIYIAGSRSETLFGAQAYTEEQIDTVVGSEDALIVQYPDQGFNLSVGGLLVMIEELSFDGRIVRLEVFVPYAPHSSED